MDGKIKIMPQIRMDQLNQSLEWRKNSISDMRTQHILFLEDTDFIYNVCVFLT